MLFIYDTPQIQIIEIGKKTHISSISCVIFGLHSENTYFGHFLVENQDTGQKKAFCNSAKKGLRNF